MKFLICIVVLIFGTWLLISDSSHKDINNSDIKSDIRIVNEFDTRIEDSNNEFDIENIYFSRNEGEDFSGSSLSPKQNDNAAPHYQKNNIVQSDEVLKIQKDIMALSSAASDKNWRAFDETLASLEHIDQNMLNLALLKAISSNAPFEIISSLLNNGAQFSAGIINTLALKNNVALTRKLIPLGMDLHALDRLGRNAINYTLLSFQSKEMFDFLISHGVSIKTNSEEPDALAMALSHTINYDATYYIQRLIDYGSPIESDHIQLLQEISKTNKPIYEQLKVNAPEFFNN